MGRPTKLTPETHEKIVKALAIGATRRDAFGSVGIPQQTFLNWLEWGAKARSGVYFDFFDAVSKAEAEARLKFTGVIAKAASEGDWRAAMEYLKRRDPEQWGDSVAVQHTGKDGGPIETKTNVSIEIGKLTTEQIEQLIAIAESAEIETGTGAA